MTASHASQRGTDEITVLQHWDAEGEDPLAPIIERFERSNDVSFVNEVEPIATLRLMVKGRVLREDPPDLWIEWPGKNLRLTVEAGVTADVSDVWASENLESHFVDGATDAARFDGEYHCVPTDMYRINNLFYNRRLVDEAGVAVDRIGGPDELLEALGTLDDALDVPALQLNGKDPFGPLQLWETLVIAYGGPDTYEELLAGRGSSHRDVIERAVETLDRMYEYAPADVEFTSSDGADRRFVDGGGAMTHNGGWAVGRLSQGQDFEYGEDWGHAPFPGTDRAYQMNMNSIVPASHVEDDETVLRFLRHVSSAESITSIGSTLGAVPPRTDVRVADLHPVTQEHHGALEATEAHLASMTHGLGVEPDQVIDLKDAMGTFVRDRDVAATTRELVDALSTEPSG